MAANPPLKILFLSAEVVPFAKTGGLADVAGSLPKAIRALGHDVRVCMPRYGRVDRAKFDLQEVAPPFVVPMDHDSEMASIWRGTIGKDVPVYMVDNARYFMFNALAHRYPHKAAVFLTFN